MEARESIDCPNKISIGKFTCEYLLLTNNYIAIHILRKCVILLTVEYELIKKSLNAMQFAWKVVKKLVEYIT